jgi:hypothetical protein
LVVKKYVGDGIQKIIYLIQEIWELAQISISFSTRIMHFKEYLQKYLENDEGFYEVVGTFSKKKSSLSDTHRRDQNLPSITRMKQSNAYLLKITKILGEMLNELDVVKSKRGALFLKFVDITRNSTTQIYLWTQYLCINTNY